MSDEIKIKVWSEDLDPDEEHAPYDSIGEISGSGYYCLDCGNNQDFSGSYSLYRLYEGEESDYEFWSEIPVPHELNCKCGSNNIYVEYKEGWSFKFLENEFMILVGNKTLICFEDADGDFELLKLLDCDIDSIMYGKASNLLDQMQEWEMNDFESFEKNDCAIVRIHAKGQLVQEEYGLSDNESTYKGIEFSSFTID